MQKIIFTIILSCYSSIGFATIDITNNLSLSGFGSTSLAKSDNQTAVIVNRYIDDQNCYDCDTTFGLQLDYYNQSFRSSIQVVKRPQDNWSTPELEWAYLAYSFESVELKAGRLRLPLFLKSEYYYVGHAYTQARPPTELYNVILGITAFNGFSVVWNQDITESLNLAITPFVGFKDTNKVTVNTAVDMEFETNHLVGLNALLSGDNYRWNFAFLGADYDQTTTVPGFSVREYGSKIDLYTLGFEYYLDQFTLAAEGQTSNFSSSWYTSLSYNWNVLTPYGVYGREYNEDKNTTGDSYLLGLRYDVYTNISINAEWQYFEAHAGGGSFISAPGKDRDANLYTVMLNFIF